jgi:hypothetical protein
MLAVRAWFCTFAGSGMLAHYRECQMSCHAVSALWHKNLTHDATTIGDVDHPPAAMRAQSMRLWKNSEIAPCRCRITT